MAEFRPGAASCPNGSATMPPPRRIRALSADCTYELASLARQAEGNLSMSELGAKICTQPLARSRELTFEVFKQEREQPCLTPSCSAA